MQCGVATALLSVMLLVATRPVAASLTTSAPSVTVANARVGLSDFPDPFVLSANGRYYAYATNVGSAHVPIRVSADLVHWKASADALPRLPDWARTSNLTWAPSVRRVGRKFLMYLTVFDNRRGTHCIAIATSKHAAGPFTLAAAPLVCGSGAIDASPFQAADGSLWLTWKSEASSATSTGIVSQRLSTDGTHLVGKMAVLISPTLIWEDGVVEGPSMIYRNGFYMLFYAASDWTSDHYATGLAVCVSAQGPCVKSSAPVLASTSTRISPGGLTAFNARGAMYVAFHVWRDGIGYPWGKRCLVVARVVFDRGTLRFEPVE